MKVLSVASEAVPLVKTGGLADVAGALPGPMATQGVEMRLLLPGYPSVSKAAKRKKRLHTWSDFFGGTATIVDAELAGSRMFYLDAPHLYDRPGGPYSGPDGNDWTDNWRRFAALGRAAAEMAEGVAGWQPDLVHAHDWQAAMAAAYMRFGRASNVPSVLTVHNLAFQGRFGGEIFGQLGLPAEAMSVDGVEYYGGVGFLKAGLQSAWAVTTVSPTYAREIRTPAFGMGLDGLINMRSEDLHGILNGIDTHAWNPGDDPLLPSTFTAKSLKGRMSNRRHVEERFGLDSDASLLVCIISRLTWQKGMDLVTARFDEIIAAGARLAILGSGDHGLEGALLAAAARHRGRAGVVIGYDEPLSHLMQGGCDAILIPSRFEPCGLTQMYGLRYGCVPLVARTGGLADTVIEANEAALSAGAATGLMFQSDHADALADALHRAVSLHGDRELWTSMQRAGMRADLSWERSAAKYAALYRSLLERRSDA